mmetsp:Transcript_6726/g.9804  ORF Transcript_6726/g.9804 Transcript_6726/m.9804 type:complete len:325 (+) Transcript_6726:113-1087(+)
MKFQKIGRLVLIICAACMSSTALSADANRTSPPPSSSSRVPQATLQAFGSYPNLLNITHEMRENFHPVVKLPKRKKWKDWLHKRIKSRTYNVNDSNNSCDESLRGLMNIYNYIVKDYTGKSNKDNDVTLPGGKKVPQLLPTREEALEFAKTQKKQSKLLFDVGRYDEDRRGMYTSSLFDARDEEKRRTIHVGIDIGGPVGVKIYSFVDGVIHSLGYNEAIGDYGHVIVVEHQISESSKCWALYGHLDANSIKGKHVGQKIKKGEVIGGIGDTSENGGWTGTHLHFQVAMTPPSTHDMPGVVSLKDREDALLEYVDPRYILGKLY